MRKFRNLGKYLNIINRFAFIILIGLLLYTIYKSEILYSGFNRDYYLKFYYFLIFSFLILVFVNFFNRKIKLAFYTMLISTIIGLYISEALLINYKKLGEKTKYQLYEDLKKKQDVTVAVQPFQYILKDIEKKKIFPLSGIAKKLTILCRRVEDGKFVTYESDRYGFRNEDINWDNGEINLVLLGDSFVHGNCVDNDKIISSQISKIHKAKFNKKINIINLGYSGNGPLIEYATLKEYLKYIKTKKILYFFYEGNDILNLSLELKDPFLKQYLKDEYQQGLIKRQADVDEANYNLIQQEIQINAKVEAIYHFIKLWRVRGLISKVLNLKLKKKSDIELEKTYETYNNILIKIKKLAQNQDAELYFVYIPNVATFSNGHEYGYDKIYSKVMSMVKDLDIEYIDFLSELKSEQTDPSSMFQLKKFSHLNEKGYNFLAKTIINKIK